MNRYQNILDRKDKERPFYLKELHGDEVADLFKALGDCFVLKVKLLTSGGGLIEYNWSEPDGEKKVNLQFPRPTKKKDIGK